MAQISTVRALEEFGRRQLSPSFFMRDFLFSDIAAVHGLSNLPDDPDLAVEAGSRLCCELLEPLQKRFGRIAIRSAYRSCEVNAFGNKHKLGCSSNERNFAKHIWDRRDDNGMGAVACIVVPSFAHRHRDPGDWKMLAWWIHDHLPYSTMQFFPKLWACNLGWHERPARTIYSYIDGEKGFLSRPGDEGHDESHEPTWSRIAA